MTNEEFLQSIQPGIKLTKDFFLQIYGYGITRPEFVNQALEKLEKMGCLKAKQYYETVVEKYESQYNAQMKEVAHWYARECEEQWQKRLKEGEEKRKQQRNTPANHWNKFGKLLNFQ